LVVGIPWGFYYLVLELYNFIQIQKEFFKEASLQHNTIEINDGQRRRIS